MNIKCMEIIICLLPWETHSWSVGKYISWHYQGKKVKVYVCLYSHSWVYARTCKSVFLCHLHLCLCVCVVVRVCVCFCVSTRACVCVCTKEICMYVCINWRFFLCLCLCMLVCACVWSCVSVCDTKRGKKTGKVSKGTCLWRKYDVIVWNVLRQFIYWKEYTVKILKGKDDEFVGKIVISLGINDFEITQRQTEAHLWAPEGAILL